MRCVCAGKCAYVCVEVCVRVRVDRPDGGLREDFGHQSGDTAAGGLGRRVFLTQVPAHTRTIIIVHTSHRWGRGASGREGLRVCVCV